MAKESMGKKVALGAAVAGVAGFVAGILTAPKSGKETRKDIKNAAIKAKSEAEKNLKAMHSELNSRLADVKAKGEELSGKAKDEFDDIVEKAKSAKEKVRDVLSSLHDGDADDPDLKKALKDAKDSLKNLEKFVKS
jgi:gas vesicle protein